MNTKNRTIWIRILLAFAMVFTLALTSVQTVRALEVDNDGRVGADEVINDDLFLSQDIVEMAGTVNGNLVAMGSAVTISGTVNGDVIAGGSTVTITGTVNGNVFAMGGDVIVEGQVENSLFFAGSSLVVGSQSNIGSNLYAGGFSVDLQSGSKVGKDIAVGGYQVMLGGEIGRDVHAGVGALELTGKVGRNITVDVGEPTEDSEDMAFMNFMPFSHVSRFLPVGLHIASEAVIGGKLEYYSAVEQPAGILATPESGVVYHYRAPQDGSEVKDTIKDNVNHVAIARFDFAGMVLNYVFGVIREFLTLVLLGALAVWLIPSLLSRTADKLRAKPLPSLGWGFLVLIVGLIALALACIAVLMFGLAIGVVTLFGLMSVVFGIGFSAISLSGAVFLAIAQYGSKLVVALLIGDWILRLFRKDYSASSFWPLLLGILLMVLVDAVPIMGTLVSLFVILFGFGAIWLVFRDWWQTRNIKA